jgi:hypothetical protein
MRIADTIASPVPWAAGGLGYCRIAQTKAAAPNAIRAAPAIADTGDGGPPKAPRAYNTTPIPIPVRAAPERRTNRVTGDSALARGQLVPRVLHVLNSLDVL